MAHIGCFAYVYPTALPYFANQNWSEELCLLIFYLQIRSQGQTHFVSCMLYVESWIDLKHEPVHDFELRMSHALLLCPSRFYLGDGFVCFLLYALGWIRILQGYDLMRASHLLRNLEILGEVILNFGYSSSRMPPQSSFFSLEVGY